MSTRVVLKKSLLSFCIFFCSFLFLIFISSCKKTEIQPHTVTPPPVPTGVNIIVILGDDIGYEVPTCNGGQSYATPNIDMMAAQGMRFTECHATPLCSPSRFELLTGKYNFRNYSVWGDMDQSQRTIANMLQSAGYATCVAGKWQFDGGDQSIHIFGYDNYAVWDPFEGTVQQQGSRYKNPLIYENAAYLPDSAVNNKYGDDIFTDYVLNFIDSNYNKKPFFVYYPLALCHEPFCPTPNDPDFLSTPPLLYGFDTSYFPSMVNYMDQKIGMIINKINSLGIQNNTLILFMGDNGTPDQVTSIFNGINIQGGKGLTIEAGTHVPCIAYWPGKIPAGAVNNDLIDFTDFLPTLADAAGISHPTTYGPLDGVSFAPRLTQQTGTPRNWLYLWYEPNYLTDTTLRIYAQNTNYKYFSTSGNFYNIITDPMQLSPIPNSNLSQQEQQAKKLFQGAIQSFGQ